MKPGPNEAMGGAKRRLADEYDAAQERGEVVGRNGGGDTTVPVRNAATAADIGLTRKQIHEARAVRDAEKNDPGVIRNQLIGAAASFMAQTPPGSFSDPGG